MCSVANQATYLVSAVDITPKTGVLNTTFVQISYQTACHTTHFSVVWIYNVLHISTNTATGN